MVKTCSDQEVSPKCPFFACKRAFKFVCVFTGSSRCNTMWSDAFFCRLFITLFQAMDLNVALSKSSDDGPGEESDAEVYGGRTIRFV